MAATPKMNFLTLVSYSLLQTLFVQDAPFCHNTKRHRRQTEDRQTTDDTLYHRLDRQYGRPKIDKMSIKPDIYSVICALCDHATIQAKRSSDKCYVCRPNLCYRPTFIQCLLQPVGLVDIQKLSLMFSSELYQKTWSHSGSFWPTVLSVEPLVHCFVCLSVFVCRLSVTFCIVAKRCVLDKKCLKE